MDRLVSVYLPTHNRRQLLERAVESVLGQTYSNIELVVVNDGSTDDTSIFLDERCKSDHRILSLANKLPLGASQSRNIAVKAAKGIFISGLDDDDEFTPDRIAQFVNYWDALSTPSSRPVCLFSQSLFVGNGNPHQTQDRKDRVQFLDLFNHNYIGNQVFCMRDDLIAAGLFDENLNAWEDLDLFMRLLKDFGEARLVNASTYVCDVSTNRDRISRNEIRIRSAFELISAKYPDLPSALHQGLYLQMFSGYHGIRPTIDDFRRFQSWGFNMSGLVQLLKPLLKAVLAK
jgi:glycosyltransferase involved in cell wall biosynthesis